MKTNELVIKAVALCKREGFAHTRDTLWSLYYAFKITDSQLAECLGVLHAKGY